jgi:hypothetical protein
VVLNSSKKSAYASSTAIGLNLNITTRPTTATSNPNAITQEIDGVAQNPQLRAVNKLLSRLPFELRDSIMTALGTVVSDAEHSNRERALLKLEVITLQNEILDKNSDFNNLENVSQVQRQRIANLESKLDDMKDSMDSRQKYLVKNRRSVDRMAATNRM